MKKTSLMMWLFLSLIVPWATHAQSSGGNNPIYTCDFESSVFGPATDKTSEWILGPATTQQNHWVIGKSSGQFSVALNGNKNNKALFIANQESSTPGSYNYQYTLNQQSISYAYHPITVRAGESFYISFDLKIAGLAKHAGLRVFLAPRTSLSKINDWDSASFFGNTFPANSNFKALDGGSVITRSFGSDFSTFTGSTTVANDNTLYYLVFCWFNGQEPAVDGSGLQPLAAIDNIECSYTPACLLVTNLRCDGVSSTTSNFSWSWNEDMASTYQYQYLYGIAGFTPDWSNATSVETSSMVENLSIYGLLPFTYYDLYVRPACSDEQEPTMIRFITDPNPNYDPLNAFYATTFETNNAETLLDAWKWRVGAYSDNDQWDFVQASTGVINHWVIGRSAIDTLPDDARILGKDINKDTNDLCLYITNEANHASGKDYKYAYTTDYATKTSGNVSGVVFAYRTTPIHFDGTPIEASYIWKAMGETDGIRKDYLRLFLVPVTSDGVSAITDTLQKLANTHEDNNFSNTWNRLKLNDGWVSLDNGVGLNGSNSWVRDTFPCVNAAGQPLAGNYVLVVAWINDARNGAQYPAAVDNILFAKSQSCTPPVANIWNVTDESASFYWDNFMTELFVPRSYQLFCDSVGKMPDWNNVPVLPTNFRDTTFTELDPYTSYEFFIRSYCSDNEQSAVVRIPFTTKADCNPNYVLRFETNAKTDTIPFGHNAQSKVFMVFDQREVARQITNINHEYFNSTVNGMSFGFAPMGNAVADVNFKVYLANVTPTDQPYGVLQPNEMTLVFDGSRHFEAQGVNYKWNEIVFNTPFNYDRDSSLAVLVVRDQPISFSSKDSLLFYTCDAPAGAAEARCYVYNSAKKPNGWYRWGRPATHFTFCSDDNKCAKARNLIVTPLSSAKQKDNNDPAYYVALNWLNPWPNMDEDNWEIEATTSTGDTLTFTCTSVHEDTIQVGTGDNQLPFNTTFTSFRVRRNCGNGVYSEWASASCNFRTVSNEANILSARILDDDHLQIGDASINTTSKKVTITYRKGFSILSKHCDLALTISQYAQGAFHLGTSSLLPNADGIYYFNDVELSATTPNQVDVKAENGDKQTWTFVFQEESCASPYDLTAEYNATDNTIEGTIVPNPRVPAQSFSVSWKYEQSYLDDQNTIQTMTNDGRIAVPAGTTTFTIPNAFPGAEYAIQVNAVSTSCTSASLYDTVEVPAACDKPEIQLVNAGLYDASFSWSHPSATSFRYILRNAKGQIIRAGETEGNNLAIDGLDEYTNYSLTVQAHCLSTNPLFVSKPDTLNFTTQARCLPPVIDTMYQTSKSVVHVEWHNGSLDANGVASQPNHFNYGISNNGEGSTDLSLFTNSTATSGNFDIWVLGDTYTFAIMNTCYLTDEEVINSPVATRSIETAAGCLWPDRRFVALRQSMSNSLQLKFVWTPNPLAEESDNLELLVIPSRLEADHPFNEITLNTLQPTYSNVASSPFDIEQALDQRLERGVTYRVYYRPMCSDTWNPNRYVTCSTRNIDACPSVQGLKLDYLATDTASFSWNQSTAEFFSSYTVRLYDIYNHLVKGPVTVSDNHIGFGGLTSNAFYTIGVTTNCDEFEAHDQHSHEARLNFHAQTTCNRPINMEVNTITSNSAVLSWMPGNADSNEIIVNGNLIATIDPADYTVDGLASFTLSDLTPYNNYFVTINTLCNYEFFNEPIRVPAEDGPVFFRTLDDLASFASYSIEGSYQTDFIAGVDADTIHLMLRNGTNLETARPDFRLTSNQAKAFINGRQQFSHLNVIDLTQPVVYTVVAGDTNIKRNFVVTYDFESCTKPQYLQCVTRSTSADLTWTVPTDDSHFRVVIYSGFGIFDSIVNDQPDITLANSGVRTYHVSPLTPDHKYTAVVYTICGNELSDPSFVYFTAEDPADLNNPCLAPANLVVTDNSDGHATLSWSASQAEKLRDYRYQFVMLDEGIPVEETRTDWTYTENTTVSFSNLQDLASYQFLVEANCPVQEVPAHRHSTAQKIEATIQTACPSFLKDNKFDRERISNQSVRISWNWNYAGDYRCVLSPVQLDSAALANAQYSYIYNTREITIDTLNPVVDYYFYISHVCSEQSFGNWDSVDVPNALSTACPEVDSVKVIAVSPYSVTVHIFNPDTIDNNKRWHLVVNRKGDDSIYFKDTITDSIWTVTGLDPDTCYNVIAGYYCLNGVVTKTMQTTFCTPEVSCEQFAEQVDFFRPFVESKIRPFGNEGFQRHAYIYTAEDDDNLVPGTIKSLTWNVNGNLESHGTVKVYLKNIESHDTAFCNANKLIWSTMISGATKVFDGNINDLHIVNNSITLDFSNTEDFKFSADSNLMLLVESSDISYQLNFARATTRRDNSTASLIYTSSDAIYNDSIPFTSVQHAYARLSNQRPATTFCIEASGCLPVRDLKVVDSERDANSATITWTPGRNESAWDVALDDKDKAVRASNTYFTFNNLSAHSFHIAYVRPAVEKGTTDCADLWKRVFIYTNGADCHVVDPEAFATDDNTWTISFTKECDSVDIITEQWNNSTLQFEPVTLRTAKSSVDFARAPQAHTYFFTLKPVCNNVIADEHEFVFGTFNDSDCGTWTVTDATPYQQEFNYRNLNCWSATNRSLASDISFYLPEAQGVHYKAAFRHSASINGAVKFVVNDIDTIASFSTSRDLAYDNVDLDAYAGQTITISFVNPDFRTRQTINDILVFTAEDYQLTVDVNDPSMGSVTPDGTNTMPAGYVELNATPASDGYMFKEWASESGLTMSTDPTYTFLLSRDTKVKANFAPRTSRIITGVAAGYERIGSVVPTMNQLVDFGTEIELTATANEGYRFDCWNDGVTDNPRTITVGVNNASYYAYFQDEITHSYQDLTVCDVFTYTDLEGVSHSVTESNEDVTVPVRVSTGVDSVHINLTVNYTATSTTEQTACNAYVWNGNSYTESGEYPVRFAGQAANGCDSVATLVLTIHQSVTTDTFATVCDRFDWYEHPAITVSCNNLTHVLTDQYGCDSILRLNLTVNYSVAVTEAVTTCDSLNWNGLVYPYSGTYTQHFIAANGCDSLHTVNLSIVKHFTKELAATACDSYTWRNETYTRSGDYHQVFEGDEVCDTFATLHLTINYSTTADTFAAACNTFDWYEHTNLTTSTDACKHLFSTVDGCDSLVTLHLTVNYSDTTRTSHVACGSYNWNGSDYKTSGVYQQTLTNVYGCDSVVFLNLTINPVYNDTVDHEACVSYTWNDQTYTVSGLYTQEFTSIDGCDSIRTINLTVKPNIYNQVSATACVSYTWNEETYEESGVYTQTFNPASNGCDSIVTLTLTINQPVAYEYEATDCDSYTWNTTTYTTSGDYVQTFRAANNCDSVVTLHLTVNYSANTEFSATACDSYTWNNVTYTTSGNYTQHFNTINGCDSTVVLHLTINNSVNNAFSATACDSYTWNDQTYTTSGDKVQVLQTSKGCDSTVVLHLTINNSYAVSTSATACDSYTWNNQTYNTTGSYVQTLRAANGCDSVVTLALTVNYSANTEFNATDCDSYTWNGQTYATSGNYTQHFTTVNGCDSTVVLHLTINRSYYGEISRVACVSYSWYGVTYTQSGNYRHIGTTPQGCDSIIDLHLTINQPVQSSNTVVACESYTWAASHETYTVSGDYQVTIANGAVNGCDSTAVLHLTINHGTHNAATEVACLSFNWHGVEYTRSGDYTYNYVNDLNCNSTDTLHLTVIPMQGSASAVTACESYSWNDVTYTTSGTYYHDYVLDGCPAKDTLVLTVNYGSHHAASVVECDSYIWNGIPYTSTGTYLYNYTNDLGCPSVDTLHLTIYPSTSSVEQAQTYTTYTWNGNTYSASGEYSVHFVNQYGCDSTATLQLTVIPLGFPTPIIRLRDNKSLVVDHYPTGNERVDYIAYRWYRDGELIVNDTDDTYMNIDGSDLDGHYYVMVPVDNQRSAWVASNVITVGREGVDDIDNSEFTLTVAPNPVLAGSVVNVSTDLTTERLQGAICTLYDINGRVVICRSMTEASITFNAELTAGTYTVEVRTSDGSRLVQRLVVVR